MEDHENVEPPSAESDLSRELAVLKAERSNLLAQLDYETDPDVRAEIDVHLMQNRMHIERLVGDFTGEIPTIRRTERSYVVPTGEHRAIRGDYDNDAFAAPGPQQLAANPNTGGGSSTPIRWRWVATGALVTLCVAGLIAVSVRLSDSDEQPNNLVSDTTTAESGLVDEISAVLTGMGHGDVMVRMEGEVIVLAGTVASEDVEGEHRGRSRGARRSQAGRCVTELLVQASETTEAAPAASTPRADALQQDINRTLASTPLIFQSSATDLTELHRRILNDLATSLLAYPELSVRVVGYSDSVGDPETNSRVSLSHGRNRSRPTSSSRVCRRGTSSPTPEARRGRRARRVSAGSSDGSSWR